METNMEEPIILTIMEHRIELYWITKERLVLERYLVESVEEIENQRQTENIDAIESQERIREDRVIEGNRQT